MPYNNEILGYMLESELKVLESLALRVPENGTIVEVGSFMGRSGVCFAMTAPTAKVYCIDDFYDHDWILNKEISDEFAEILHAPRHNQVYNVQKEFTKNTENFPNIIPIKGHCPNVEYTGGDIDLLFVDTSHTNPSDWDILTHLVPKVKPGGIICGHDYGHRYPDVIQNVYRLEQILQKQRTLYLMTSIWSFELPYVVPQDLMISMRDQS